MGMTLIWVLLSIIAVSLALAILPSVLWALGIFFIIILVVYALWFFINFIVWIAPIVFLIALGSLIWGLINKMTGRPTGFKGAWFNFGNGFKDKFKRKNKKRSDDSMRDYEREKDRILDQLNNGDLSVEQAMEMLEKLKNKYM